MFRLVGFRVGGFGHHPVFGRQMGRFTPVAPIHHAPEHVLHALAFHRLPGLFDDHFQKVVGLFQLVVKAEIVLGQFEFLQATLFRHDFPHDVESRKEPAPAGLLLGGDSPGLHFHRKGSLVEGRLHGHKRQVRQVGFGQGTVQGPGGCIPVIGSTEFFQQGIVDFFHWISFLSRQRLFD